MADPDMKSVNRIEETGDRLRVVVKRVIGLVDYRGEKNVLTAEYPDLFLHLVHGADTIRVGSAAHVDGADGYRMRGANALFYEAEVVERELTAGEEAWCEETVMYRGSNKPDTVFEFEIPHPDRIRDAVQANDPGIADMEAVIPDADTRDQLVRSFQTRLEEEKFRESKLHWSHGNPEGLPPEWHPEHSDHDRDSLSSMASSRVDATKVDFEDVAGFTYQFFFNARKRELGVYEPDIDDWHLVALDLIGKEDWSYCRACAKVAPEADLLYVQKRGKDDGHRFRVCESCADKNLRNRFTEELVAEARDRRAKRNGEGQRRLKGFEDE